ncbi:MAG TPA: thioesterase family protein [Jiangellaceae bacterium]
MARHVSSVPVRWSDIDRLGHVNNVVLLRYLQEARVDMLFRDAAGRGTAGLASGVLIHRHDVTYRSPIRIDAGPDGRPHPVRVDTRIGRVTAASFEVGYEVRDSAGTVCATATSVVVPYDLGGDHLRRLTTAERTVLDGFRDDMMAGDGHSPAPAMEDATFSTECAVRFDDLDSYGHVNNVTIAEYLQQARIDLGRAHLDGHREEHQRQVIARLVIDYARPIPFRTEPVRVDLVVTRIGTSSVDLAYTVRDDDAVYARAASTMVAYDVRAAESRPLGEGERDALEQLRAPVRTVIGHREAAR